MPSGDARARSGAITRRARPKKCQPKNPNEVFGGPPSQVCFTLGHTQIVARSTLDQIICCGCTGVLVCMVFDWRSIKNGMVRKEVHSTSNYQCCHVRLHGFGRRIICISSNSKQVGFDGHIKIVARSLADQRKVHDDNKKSLSQ